MARLGEAANHLDGTTLIDDQPKAQGTYKEPSNALRTASIQALFKSVRATARARASARAERVTTMHPVTHALFFVVLYVLTQAAACRVIGAHKFVIVEGQLEAKALTQVLVMHGQDACDTFFRETHGRGMVVGLKGRKCAVARLPHFPHKLIFIIFQPSIGSALTSPKVSSTARNHAVAAFCDVVSIIRELNGQSRFRPDTSALMALVGGGVPADQIDEHYLHPGTLALASRLTRCLLLATTALALAHF